MVKTGDGSKLRKIIKLEKSSSLPVYWLSFKVSINVLMLWDIYRTT